VVAHRIVAGYAIAAAGLALMAAGVALAYNGRIAAALIAAASGATALIVGSDLLKD